MMPPIDAAPLPWDDPQADPAQDCADLIGRPVFGKTPRPPLQDPDGGRRGD